MLVKYHRTDTIHPLNPWLGHNINLQARTPLTMKNTTVLVLVGVDTLVAARLTITSLRSSWFMDGSVPPKRFFSRNRRPHTVAGCCAPDHLQYLVHHSANSDDFRLPSKLIYQFHQIKNQSVTLAGVDAVVFDYH